MMGQEYPLATDALGDAIDEPSAQLQNFRRTNKAFLLCPAEEVRLHLHCNRQRRGLAKLCHNCQPHRCVCRRHVDRTADDTSWPHKSLLIGKLKTTLSIPNRVKPKAI